jgi:hypothetical protein
LCREEPLNFIGCKVTADASVTENDVVNHIYNSLSQAYSVARTISTTQNTIVSVCIHPGTYPDDLTIDTNQVVFTSNSTAGAKGSIPNIVDAIFSNASVVPIGEVLITGTWTLSGGGSPYLYANSLTFQSSTPITSSGVTAGGEVRINDCIFYSDTISTGPLIDLSNGPMPASTLLLLIFDSLITNRGFFDPNDPPSTPPDNQAIHLGENTGCFIDDCFIAGGQAGAPASGPSSSTIQADGTGEATPIIFVESRINGSIYINRPSSLGPFGATSGVNIDHCSFHPLLGSNNLGFVEFGPLSNVVNTGTASPYKVSNTTFEGGVPSHAFTSTVAADVFTSGNGNLLAGGAGAITDGAVTNTSVASF